jgi:hypothetical protein
MQGVTNMKDFQVKRIGKNLNDLKRIAILICACIFLALLTHCQQNPSADMQKKNVSEQMPDDGVITSYHSSNKSTPVHQHIAWQAALLWKEHNNWQAFPGNFGNYISGDFNLEKALILGTRIEDEPCSPDPLFDNCPGFEWEYDVFIYGFTYCAHFWDHDNFANGQPGLYYNQQWPSAYARATDLYDQSKLLYSQGNYYEAYILLGRVVHLLTDMGVPAHVHSDIHLSLLSPLLYGIDSYEYWMKSHYNELDYSSQYSQWSIKEGKIGVRASHET